MADPSLEPKPLPGSATVPLRVLLVEDSADDADLIVRELRRTGWAPVVERVDNAEAMGAALDRQPWDVVLTDYAMPTFGVPAALNVIRTRGLDLPVIIVSGSIGEPAAVASMKLGAHDYVMKDHLARLGPAIERELKEARNRQERRRMDDVVRQLAYYDALTGLPNRSLLFDRLQETIRDARRVSGSAALLHLDLNRFWDINSTLGHRSGDALLRQVARRLADGVPAPATVARLGGDEFAVLLPSADPGAATAAAASIARIMQTGFALDGITLEVGLTMGIALWPAHAPDADVLIQQAGIALVAAKRERAGWLVYDAAMDRVDPRRLALAGDLRAAINGNQLILAFQPEYEIAVGRTLGVEALVRWQHPVHGLLGPDEFIGLGEKTGMIQPLTLRVLDGALAHAKRWQAAGMDLSVAVNLSTRNLQDARFPDRVEELLRARGLSGGCLEFEITESAIMEDPKRALRVFGGLSELGATLAIDDFGTGYSSLSYLKKLPVSVLKIDKSFVTNLVSDRGDAVIVRSTIELAHMLGLTVVAEGVESGAVLDQLAAFGCDAAQGFHVSRPLPGDAVDAWLRDSPWGWGSEPARTA